VVGCYQPIPRHEYDVMAMPKYAQSTDLNQSEIVDALRKIGCQVEIIGTPVDLLVGYRVHNFLLEVKRPGAYVDKRQKTQRDFIRDWPGQVRVVETPEEAIRVVTRAYK